jgi:hypothetical protein
MWAVSFVGLGGRQIEPAVKSCSDTSRAYKMNKPSVRTHPVVLVILQEMSTSYSGLQPVL